MAKSWDALGGVKEAKRIIVIGGGPGGYVAAIRAAQLGAKVVLIEKERIGGTCLNVGCIPTKVLLHTAEIYSEVKAAQDIGLKVPSVEVDWEGLQNRKEDVVNQLVDGVKGLLAANNVDSIEGSAEFVSRNKIRVTKKDGSATDIEADAIIIASGSSPFIPPIEGMMLDGVIDSSGALSLKKLPPKMVIIGGGIIGVEFATAFNSLGCDVSIVEMLPYILPPIDREIADILYAKLIEKGIKIYNNAKVLSVKKIGNLLSVNVQIDGKEFSVEGEKILVSAGRRADTDKLNLQAVGIAAEKGYITVDERMETSVKGIYAVGDCTGKNMLAHVASRQGEVAAENLMEIDSIMDYKTVPACVYTKPELAYAGLTEEQAVQKGIEYKVGRFPLTANGKSIILNEYTGLIKIIADKKYNEILGVHILGPRATELITEGALAIRLEATVEEIVTTIHAHPTVGEALQEAALSVDNRSIHMPPK
ncbi:MAG: dihydrolipoyl dehydrogenase [Clostridiaceae bacterium]|nr:dihydrolipoyl dehydrogenase [Clostridiaceae bacterium]